MKIYLSKYLFAYICFWFSHKSSFLPAFCIAFLAVQLSRVATKPQDDASTSVRVKLQGAAAVAVACAAFTAFAAPLIVSQ